MGAAAVPILIGLTGINIIEQKKRARDISRAQEKQTQIESAIRGEEARKARREQIRAARIKQSQIENIAANAGQTESSAAIATTGSLQTKLGTNIGNINEALASSGLLSRARQDVLNASQPSNLELFSGAGIDIASIYASKK